MISQNEAVDALLSAGYSIGVEEDYGIILEKLESGTMITVEAEMLHLNQLVVPKELRNSDPLAKIYICISYALRDCKLDNGKLILPDPCTYFMH